VLDRLRVLAWGYAGGKGSDAAFIAALPFLYGDDFAEIQQDWFRTVVYLARYLRQPIPWILAQPLDELNGYTDALKEMVRAESGAGGASGATRVPLNSPFGAYDGGG
jgi:hypothetical protein